MKTTQAALNLLVQKHPHSAAMVHAFSPLLEAQVELANDLPILLLAELDRAAFAQGKAWISFFDASATQYVDDDFLAAAPQKFTQAACAGLPEKKKEIEALGKFLEKNPDLCKKLITFFLAGHPRSITNWAKKNEQDTAVTTLFAMHMAGATARRVAKAASKLVLPKWEKGYCPVCGSRPHTSYLNGTEGNRYLQCSLCRHEWRFSRTTCPVCEQETLKNLPVFFLENTAEERAEACEECKHYLLSVDMRNSSGDIPLELTLLCMMPLDILMQEKEYVPASNAG